MGAPLLDSPLCLEIGRLVTRLDLHGPEHEWFDPFAYSGLWAAPDWKVLPLGCTPRLGAAPIVAPESSSLLVRPLLFDQDPRQLELVPAETRGLFLDGIDDGAAEVVAERFALERLVVAPAGALTKRGYEAIASIEGLTHLVLPHVSSAKELALLAGLKNLRFLVLEGLDVDAEALRHLVRFEKLAHLHVGQMSADDAELAPLRSLPLETLSVAFWRCAKGAGLRGFERLRDLHLSRVDAAGFEAILSLRELEHLDLRVEEEADMSRLAGLTKLRSLSVSPAHGELDWVARLRGLERLRLIDSGYREQSLEPVAKLERLVELCLPDRMRSDESLAPLGALTGLRALDLKSAGLTGSGLRHLAKLPRLERINLFNNFRIDPAGLSEVAKLPALRALNLGSCHHPFEDEQKSGLTDEGVARLAASRSLRRLDLRGNRISPAAVRAIRAALPDCRVDAAYMVRVPFGDLLQEADAMIDGGRLDEAEPILAKVVAAHPDHPDGHLVAARMLEARGDLQGAHAACTRAIEADGGPQGFVQRAAIRSKLGDHAGAVADHGAVLAADPSRDEHLLRRAESCFDGGDHRGAIAGYSALIERCVRGEAPAPLWGHHASALVGNRGCARIEIEEFAAAESDFEAALGMVPGDDNKLEGRAEARLGLGRAKEALADALSVLERDPRSKTALVVVEGARRLLRSEEKA